MLRNTISTVTSNSRRSNGRTAETPSRKGTNSTKEGKLQKSSEHNTSPESVEDVPKTPIHNIDTDKVFVSGNCTSCGENSFIGVSKSTLVGNCFTGQDLLNLQLDLKNEEKGKENVASMERKKHIILKSPSGKVPQLMETKDESDLEFYDEVSELQERLLASDAKLTEKQAEWLQLEKDYLLCIRAAERGRVEAVKKLKEMEISYKSLYEQYQLLRMATTNLSTDDPIIVAKTALDWPSNEEIRCDVSPKEVACDMGRSDTKVDSDKDMMVASASNVSESYNCNNSTSTSETNKSDSKVWEERENEQILPHSVMGLQLENKDIEPTKQEKLKAETTKRLIQSFKNPRMIDSLRKAGNGSLRNALLKWCQEQTLNYVDVDITNFSTSWKNGLAAAALLHSICPTEFNFEEAKYEQPIALFKLAVKTAEEIGVKNSLNIDEVLSADIPPWEEILDFVKEVYVAVNNEASP